MRVRNALAHARLVVSWEALMTGAYTEPDKT